MHQNVKELLDQMGFPDSKFFDEPLPRKYTKTNKTRYEKPNKKTAKKNTSTQRGPQFNLKSISPKTVNQRRVFEEYNQNKNLIIHGYPGTGKTFLAVYLAMNEIINGNTDYKNVIIVRSVVPSRDMGHLPGTEEKKSEVYELPYHEIFGELFGNRGAYEHFKKSGVVRFCTTSFLRGLTFSNSIIIIEESQNMTEQEINTVMTRISETSKVVICGDFRQNDLLYKRNETSYMKELIEITSRMSQFRSIEMKIEDIVRGPLVKEWIVIKEAFHDARSMARERSDETVTKVA